MQTRPETMSPSAVGGETDISQLDPLDYPVPGQSLTDDPKNASFEQPAQTSDPAQAVDEILATFERTEIKEQMMSAIASGYPVEAIVNSLAIAGVAEGKFNPDVAEIIKPVIALYLIKTALELKIPVVPFTDEVMSEEESDRQLEAETMSNMEVLRPERARYVKGKKFVDDFTQRAKEEEGKMIAREEINRRLEEMPMESDGSFLEMEEV